MGRKEKILWVTLSILGLVLIAKTVVYLLLR